MLRPLILVVTMLSSVTLWGQAIPQMRTRIFTSLTNTEVEQYLKRNDVIFVPVGTVEPHGGMPLDCEYVGPLAYAMKMAEANDGLVLPGLVYFFPDATIVGRGGVHVTPSDGTAYLKAVARSLIRQGFRRQIYITGHAPSFDYMSPFVREIYDETGVPIVFMESTAFRRMGPIGGMGGPGGGAPGGGRGGAPAAGTAAGGAPRPRLDTMTIGAYAIAGRLDDIPIGLNQELPVHPTNPGTEYLFTLGPQSGTIGFYFPDPTDHMGPPRAITAEQRADAAKQGIASYEETVKTFDMKGVLQAMRDHDKYTQQYLIPNYGWMFPKR